MSKRKEEFYVGEYYHVYNRGVDKRKIFLDKGDLYYFIDSLQISNQKDRINNLSYKNRRKKEKEQLKDKEKIVEIVAYALLPNHFHLILKEITEGGISKFMQKLSNSYAKFFNKKYDRKGTLFQGRFQAKKIDKKQDFGLELTSAYVNLNYIHHNYNLNKDLVKTSFFEYLKKEKGEKICSEKEINKIVNSVGDVDEYKKWSKNQSEYFKDKKHNI